MTISNAEEASRGVMWLIEDDREFEQERGRAPWPSMMEWKIITAAATVLLLMPVYNNAKVFGVKRAGGQVANIWGHMKRTGAAGWERSDYTTNK